MGEEGERQYQSPTVRSPTRQAPWRLGKVRGVALAAGRGRGCELLPLTNSSFAAGQSLDPLGLQILMEAGEPDERRHAAAIMPVRKAGNLLLCTLLLGNTLVNGGDPSHAPRSASWLHADSVGTPQNLRPAPYSQPY